jgi:hypothetical protein
MENILEKKPEMMYVHERGVFGNEQCSPKEELAIASRLEGRFD